MTNGCDKRIDRHIVANGLSAAMSGDPLLGHCVHTLDFATMIAYWGGAVVFKERM